MPQRATRTFDRPLARLRERKAQLLRGALPAGDPAALYGEKLVRSFAVLTDALNRHRGKGQQVVRVEHVTVQAGGQAIVGAVTQGRRGPAEK